MHGGKKSDSIEVRLPHARKAVFMAHCRATGRNASVVLRSFIDAELELAERSVPIGRKRTLAGWAVAAALALALGAAPASMGAATPDFRPGFDSYDRDRDGLLSPAEYGHVTPGPCSVCNDPVFVLPLRGQAIPSMPGLRPFAVLSHDFAFSVVDWDHDGRISFDEYQSNWTQVLRKGFADADADHDGIIDAAEYGRIGRDRTYLGATRPQVASLEELDSNRDGRVTWLEFTVPS